jgi:ribosomal protein S18 acetylase RimI-like enzyme
MEIRTLAGIDNIKILSVFNESFSDYLIPFRLTEDQLKCKMIADKIDLELSVGVFENGKLIGFILHGFDIINNQKVVYNGGTGVIPKKRGFGLTKQMYLFNLSVLEKKGIDKIILEVISNNIQAIKSYKKSGFKPTRELACFKGNFETKKSNKEIEIKELANYPWEQMESFWDVTPTWQNSKNVLNNQRVENDALGAYITNKLVGYVICSPKSKRILQVAVHKDFRKIGIASTLVAHLAKKHGSSLSFINVDKKAKHANSFLKSVGLENYLEQFEMELILNKN